MFNFTKKEKFSIPLFVSVSLAVLFVLLITNIFFSLWLANTFFVNNFSRDDKIDKIYLKDRYNKNSDPFITKKPRLEDSLAGPIISRIDPFLGDVNAPLSLVIFSDFQCNACQQQEAVLKQIFDKYKEKVRLIWKDYPDRDIGSASFQASLAGRCADEQGKFWEYHSLLFANNKQLNKDKFIELAKSFNLNIDKFEKCLSGFKYQREIKDNITEANALDIPGVPFIYVNDQEVLGELSFEELEKMIEAELFNK